MFSNYRSRERRDAANSLSRSEPSRSYPPGDQSGEGGEGRGAKAYQFQNLTSGAQDFCSKKFNLAGVQLSVSRFIGGGTGILFLP